MDIYYQDDYATLFHGDARDYSYPQDLDLILTDPPYGISYVTSWRSRSDRKRKKVANDDDLSVVSDVWKRAIFFLHEDRHWYAFATLKPRCLSESSVLFDAKQCLIWDKGDRGTVGDLKSAFGS